MGGEVAGHIAQGLLELVGALQRHQGKVAAVYPLPGGRWFVMLADKPPPADDAISLGK